MILAKLNEDFQPKYRKLLAFASQLKAGKGLAVCVSVIQGDFTKRSGESSAARQSLRKTMEEEKVKGFVDVLIAKNIVDGLSHV